MIIGIMILLYFGVMSMREGFKEGDLVIKKDDKSDEKDKQVYVIYFAYYSTGKVDPYGYVVYKIEERNLHYKTTQQFIVSENLLPCPTWLETIYALEDKPPENAISHSCGTWAV